MNEETLGKKMLVFQIQRYILIRSFIIAFTVVSLSLFLFSPACAQFFVDGSKPADGDGQNWPTAFNSINAAMASTDILTGAEIWVRSGTYSYVEINKSVTIYGGFAGTETTLGQRDIEANETIIDGEGTNRAVLVTSAAANGTLDGFVIQHGVTQDYTDGGGIEIAATGFTLANSRVRNNNANGSSSHGGGVSIKADNVVISDCLVSDNSSPSGGGGLYYYLGSTGSGLVIRDSNFTGNQGSGIFINGWQGTAVTIERCIIAGNHADKGGGVFSGAATVNIYNSMIHSNTSSNLNFNGSGIYHYNGSTQIINSSVVNNYGIGGAVGGGIYFDLVSVSAVITNSIVWANGGMSYGDEAGSNDGAKQISVRGSVNPTITYSNIQALAYGDYTTGDPDPNYNMRKIPGFVDMDGADNDGNTWQDNDIHLQAGSYCIDYGNGNAAPATDMYNNPRFDDISVPDSGTGTPTYVDIGSHERQSSTPLVIHVDLDATGAGTGEGWIDALTSINTAASMAIDGAEIWVRAGTYLLESPVVMDRASALYGGFNGTETVRNQRDWVVYPTVIDAQSSDYRCLNITADATVDGFTVTGGRAVTNFADSNNGGGILIKGGSPAIAHCKIRNNRAIDGGGIYVYGGPDTVIDSCYISDNFAIGHNECGTNCGLGGGLYIAYGMNGALITNSVVSGNRAISVAGGIYVASDLSIMNSSIISNQADQIGGIFGPGYGQQLSVTNSIVWGNTVYSYTNHQVFINDSVVTYSDVQGGFTGPANIDQSPEFIADGLWNNNGTPADMVDDIWIDGNYRLWKNSPCIDSGTANGAPAVDIELTVRPQLSGIDMGAYEAVETVADGDVNGDSTVDLADAILALQVVAGLNSSETMDFFADINGDRRIGLSEAIYALWRTAD